MEIVNEVMQIFRYICLGIVFTWSFYRAFVTEHFIRRIGFVGLTFSSVTVAFYVSEKSINIINFMFLANLALVCLTDFAFESKKARFYDAFKSAKKKVDDVIHHSKL